MVSSTQSLPHLVNFDQSSSILLFDTVSSKFYQRAQVGADTPSSAQRRKAPQ